MLQTLAAVEGDGRTPLAEALVQGLPRMRRGMTAVVITASTDRTWMPSTGGAPAAWRCVGRDLA